MPSNAEQFYCRAFQRFLCISLDHLWKIAVNYDEFRTTREDIFQRIFYQPLKATTQLCVLLVYVYQNFHDTRSFKIEEEFEECFSRRRLVYINYCTSVY